jgi:polar amino acid transport system substrate-binding protein
MNRTMKRTFLGMAALLAAFSFTACSTFGGGDEESSSSGSTYTGSASPVLDHVRATGELRVGVSGNQPPFNMKNKAGELIGLDIDLAKALGASMGTTVRFVEMPFGTLLGALDAGEVDIVLSGLTMTPERNTKVAFAGPYFVSGKGLLTKSEKLAQTDDPEDINEADLRLVALEGSTSYGFLKQATPSAQITATRDYADAVQLIIEGKADALIADYPACVIQMFLHRDADLATVASPFTFEPLGAALPATDPLFLNLVQNYFNMLEGTGLMIQLQAKWFLDGSWLTELGAVEPAVQQSF